MSLKAAALGVVLALSVAAPAHADEDWETVVTGPITIKNRAVADSSVKEVWAQGEMAATAEDIQVALMTPERFRFFMPYITDNRAISQVQEDGSVYVYTRLDLPLVGARDYVLRTWLLKDARPGGVGSFENKWKAYPEYVPVRNDVTRVKIVNGGWSATPIGDGSKSQVSYRFLVDVGGWIPGFAVDMGNEKGVKDTFRAVEQEAQRRGQVRLELAKKHQDAGGALRPVAESPHAAPAKP